MDSDNILRCRKCKVNLKRKVFMLPCMHSFCEHCILLNRDESKTICVVCDTFTSNDDIIRNVFLEKLAVTKKLIEKMKNEVKDCETCDPKFDTCVSEDDWIDGSQYICSNCLSSYIQTRKGFNHEVVYKNKFNRSTLNVNNRKCEKHDQDLSIDCSSCDTSMLLECVHADLNKDDNVQRPFDQSKPTILQKIENIDQIIQPAKNIQSENEKNEVDVIDKNIRTNPKKPNKDYTRYKTPSFDVELLENINLCGFLQFEGNINRKKYKLLNGVVSLCFDKRFLYISTDQRIQVYDMHKYKFIASIELKKYIHEEFKCCNIFKILNNLFIQSVNYRVGKTTVYKYNIKNKTCDKWKTMKIGRLSSTNRQTILATTCYELIEFSIEGDQLQLIQIPDEEREHAGLSFYNYYKLNDGRYITAYFENNSVLLKLLDEEGKFIKSFTKNTPAIIEIFTDGDKYIYILEMYIGSITVLSMELQQIQELKIPGAYEIHFDRRNNRLYAVTKENILFFTYD